MINLKSRHPNIDVYIKNHDIYIYIEYDDKVY